MRTQSTQTLDFRLLTRRCVACGYDGITLRGGAVTNCPKCDCDFATRPARSYAEMEGLLAEPLSSGMTYDQLMDQRQETLINRWLAFTFVTMIGFVALLYLSAAALGI